MRRLAPLLCLLLAACGGWIGDADPDEVRVEPMGWDGATLAETKDHGGHYHVGVTFVLEDDADADKDRRVCVKELLRVIEFEIGTPRNLGPDWWLHSSDTQAPDADFPDAEKAWIAAYEGGPWPVFVAGWSEEWLHESVGAACDFVNAAAGREVFQGR